MRQHVVPTLLYAGLLAPACFSSPSGNGGDTESGTSTGAGESTTTEADESSGDSSPGDDTPPTPNDCIEIDREVLSVVPPAGLQLQFRVLNCDGTPTRRLGDPDITVLNGNSNEEFIGDEAGSTSAPGIPADLELYTVLVLDVSNSIFGANAQALVRDVVLSFINTQVKEAAGPLKQRVAVITFENEVLTVQEFTQDAELLTEAITLAYGDEEGESTNLYGGYIAALELIDSVGDAELLIRSVVLFTDGNHTAGNSSALREEALQRLGETEASVFVLPVGNSVEDANELASSEDHIFAAEEFEELEAQFAEAADGIRALAESNYSVGVCTPESIGVGAYEVVVAVGNTSDSFSGNYPTDSLEGAISQCDALDIAGAKLSCTADVCEIVCRERECGEDGGVSCGECVTGQVCDPEGQCLAESPYGDPSLGCTGQEVIVDFEGLDGIACGQECTAAEDCPAAPPSTSLVPVCEEGGCFLGCEIRNDQCPGGSCKPAAGGLCTYP